MEEVFVVGGLPDAAGISAAGHVASDPDVVAEAVVAMSRKGAVVLRRCWGCGHRRGGRDEGPRVFVVDTINVDGVLEGACFDGISGDEVG